MEECVKVELKDDIVHVSGSHSDSPVIKYTTEQWQNCVLDYIASGSVAKHVHRVRVSDRWIWSFSGVSLHFTTGELDKFEKECIEGKYDFLPPVPPMTLEEIIQQCLEDSRKWFPDTAEELGHHVMSLAGEVGEVCNAFKKINRGDKNTHLSDLEEEVTDVFIYLCNIAGLLGMDLVEAYERKRKFNQERFSK